MERRDKVNYYLDIAETVASRSTCIRKYWGSVIVNNDQIISTGYVGAPRGRKNCSDLGFCTKKTAFPDVRHSGYDACRSVHAEQNAIISASRTEMLNSTLYLAGYKFDENGEKIYEEGASPCLLCRKMIINSGIKSVIVRINKNEYITIDVNTWINDDELLRGQFQY